MKNYLLISLLFIVSIIVLSCNKGNISTVFIPDDYKNWSITADNLNYPVPGHGSNLRRIFINKIGEGVVSSETDNLISQIYPEGTIVIKEIFSSSAPGENEEPAVLVVMIKDSTSADARADWVWAKKDIQSGDIKTFESETCLECHNNANEPHQYGDKNPKGDFRDFLFFPFNSEY
jgi:hypothetical protein